MNEQDKKTLAELDGWIEKGVRASETKEKLLADIAGKDTADAEGWLRNTPVDERTRVYREQTDFGMSVWRKKAERALRKLTEPK